MWLRFRHRIRYSYDFGNTLPINGMDIDDIIYNESDKIMQRLIRTLDIYTFDEGIKKRYIRAIDDLYNKIAKEDAHLVKVIRDVHNRIQDFKQSKPMIFISDDKPKKVYGLYNYDDLKKVIERLLSIFKDNPGVRNRLEEILRILQWKYLPSRNEMQELEGIRDESWLKEIIDILKGTIECVESRDEEEEINGLLKKIKSIEMEAITLGEYILQDNLIVLYIYNIQDSIRRMPVSSPREALLNAVKIVLNHEMFHAFHYFCIGDDKKERSLNWSYNTRPHSLKDSVIEGLATAWEYESRPAMFGKLDVYDDWREDRRKEFENHDYPAWPYSAAREILFGDSCSFNTVYDKLAAIFYLSIIDNKYRWRISYIALNKYINNASRLNTNKNDILARIARRNIRDEDGMITYSKSEAIQKSVYKRLRAEE